MLNKKKREQETFRILKFCVVGTSNALITLGVFYVMEHLFSYDYLIANVWGYTFSLINSFIWNKLWVFQSRNTNLYKEIVWFIVAFVAAYLSQFAFMLLMVEYIGINEYLSQFLGLFIFGTVNFVLNRILTFRKKNNRTTAYR